ncbi:MAG: hypothetical protein ACJ77N_01975 [Chloroflexota bacterium]
MPAERIAENLAFINWTVVTGLAVGAFGAVAIGRLRTQATKGFLAFTAGCVVLVGLLAIASDLGLPATVSTSPVPEQAMFDVPRRVALVAFVVLAAIATVQLARGRRATASLVGGVAAGGAVLVLGAFAWGGGALGGIPLVVQLAVLAAATGGVFAAMILGHWYLVTPKLPEGPLVLFARLLLAVVSLQVVLFVAWAATNAGPGAPAGGPFAVLVGPWALFVWLRLLVGLVFPLVVSWAAVQTARTRSMESATGLLYIDVGAVAAGTILAAGLYFGAGLLV